MLVILGSQSFIFDLRRTIEGFGVSGVRSSSDRTSVERMRLPISRCTGAKEWPLVGVFLMFKRAIWMSWDFLRTDIIYCCFSFEVASRPVEGRRNVFKAICPGKSLVFVRYTPLWAINGVECHGVASVRLVTVLDKVSLR